MRLVSESYGVNCFDEREMDRRLDAKVRSALKRTIYLITLKSQQLSRMEQKLVDFLKSPHRRKRAEAQN